MVHDAPAVPAGRFRTWCRRAAPCRSPRRWSPCAKPAPRGSRRGRRRSRRRPPGRGSAMPGPPAIWPQIAPLRRRVRGADEQRALEPAVDEGRGAIDAALAVDVFGQHRLGKQLRREIVPGHRARRWSRTGMPAAPGSATRAHQVSVRQRERLARQRKAAIGEFDRRDRGRRRLGFGLAGERIGLPAPPDRRCAPTTRWRRSSGSARRSSRAAGRR